MPSAFIAIFVVFVIFAIVMGIYGHRAEKRRAEALQLWATRNGLKFLPGKWRNPANELPGFQLLTSGSNRYARHVVEGEYRGHDLLAFEFHFETTSRDSDGKTTTHHHYRTCVFLKPDFGMKSMEIRNEGFFDRLKGAFGFKDINFESAEFSKRFYVTGDDKRWCYDVIHGQMMELLMDRLDATLETSADHLLLYRTGRLEVEDLQELIPLASDILNMIPNHARLEARSPGAMT